MVRNLLALMGMVALALGTAIGVGAYDRWRDDAPPRLAVSYRGLDLASPRGVALLERRVADAVADVCPVADGAQRYDSRSDCRRRAWAGAEPQIARAVAAAEARADDARDRGLDDDARFVARDGDGRVTDDRAAADLALAPYPPAPPPPLPPPGRLVRRTVTTTTVTTTIYPDAPRPAIRVDRRAAAVRRVPPPPGRAYARRSGPGTYLPPRAWLAVELAAQRVALRGGTVGWSIPGRRGSVAAGPARRIGGRWCRPVRAVKFAYGGRITVAEGLRCRARR